MFHNRRSGSHPPSGRVTPMAYPLTPSRISPGQMASGEWKEVDFPEFDEEDLWRMTREEYEGVSGRVAKSEPSLELQDESATNRPSSWSEFRDKGEEGDCSNGRLFSISKQVIWRETESPSISSIGEGRDGKETGQKRQLSSSTKDLWRMSNEEYEGVSGRKVKSEPPLELQDESTIPRPPSGSGSYDQDPWFDEQAPWRATGSLSISLAGEEANGNGAGRKRQLPPESSRKGATDGDAIDIEEEKRKRRRLRFGGDLEPESKNGGNAGDANVALEEVIWKRNIAFPNKTYHRKQFRDNGHNE